MISRTDSLVVELQLPKLIVRVRFPFGAPSEKNMNRDRLIKITGLVFNLFLFISSMVVFFRILFAPEGDVALFRYFTNLCNIYIGIISLVIFIFSLIYFKKEYVLPKWLRILELSGVASLLLTFFTVLFFIGPITISEGNNFFDLYRNDMFLFHFLNPLISLFTFLFFTRGEKLSWKEDMFGMIPMVIYSIFYTMFVISGIWDDFYGFTFGGNNWLLPISLFVMYGVTYLISFLSSFTYNKIEGKKE